MPLQETSGSASYDAFGGGAAERVFIEDVFSCFLYTGNGSTQTITNGIDLSTKGGLVWMKGRSGATDHALYDTTRGATKDLVSNSTAAETTQSTGLTAFNTTGFSIGALAKLNTNAATYASWTFRKQPKFFDVVTYTGDGTNSRQIPHSLNSVPGVMIFKRTDATEPWYVFHRGVTSPNANWWTNYGVLNTTSAFGSDSVAPNQPTSTYISVNANWYNSSGKTYVVYLFAHDAGGFGLSGTDNVISCGSYTGTGAAGNAITTGYEPQYLLIKNTSSAASWFIYDVMRGLSVGGPSVAIIANTSDAEGGTATNVKPTATGFVVDSTSGGLNASGNTYIYIAIRRGPMKVPTSGASVFSHIAYSGANGAAQNISAGFPVDMDIIKIRNDGTRDPLNHARLMGGVFLKTDSTAAQLSFSDNIVSFSAGQNVIGLPATGGGTNEINGASTSNYIAWAFRRAPGFFDVVCYTGTSANRTVTHNLTVVPEMMIVKARDKVDQWNVYTTTTGNTKVLFLSQNASASVDTVWNNTTPTSTVFSVSSSSSVNGSGYTYVAYLFATVAGVSKVGSYTGTGTTQVINCGFTAGARFVLIKRTDSTGNWLVADSARGIVAGNDPLLYLNSTAAEITTLDWIDADSSGFIVNQEATANANVSSATYIYFAVA